MGGAEVRGRWAGHWSGRPHYMVVEKRRTYSSYTACGLLVCRVQSNGSGESQQQVENMEDQIRKLEGMKVINSIK